MNRSDFETLRLFTKNHPDRPLLTHLNADSSWLISFPHAGKDVEDESRKYYHL